MTSNSFSSTQVWGIAAAPGADRSLIVDFLTASLRSQGKKLALVQAISSSPFVEKVRPRSSQSHIDSVIARTRSELARSIESLDSALYDVILVEIEGAGQAELELLTFTQTRILVLKTEGAAEVGEIADLLVERPGPDLLVQIQKHQEELTSNGERTRRAKQFYQLQIADILSERLADSIHATFETSSGQDVLIEVLAKTLSPQKAADLISGNA